MARQIYTYVMGTSCNAILNTVFVLLENAVFVSSFLHMHQYASSHCNNPQFVPYQPLHGVHFPYQQLNLNHLLAAWILTYSKVVSCVYLIKMKYILANWLFTSDIHH